jgi:hypothetical protein
MMVEVELARVVISETSDSQIIVLREKDSERAFPIVIGIFEAAAIDRKLNDRTVPRPMTHDLLESVIRQLGAKLERVIVNDLRDNTFYARLHLRRDSDGELVDVDSRPSDAIALAVRMDVPVFVEEQVFEKLGAS